MSKWWWCSVLRQKQSTTRHFDYVSILLNKSSFVAMSWYVVFKGRRPGVYSTWELCHEQVIGYKNNWYKPYKCKKEALEAFYCHFHEVRVQKIKEDKVEKIQNTIGWKNVVVSVQFVIILVLLLNLGCWVQMNVLYFWIWCVTRREREGKAVAGESGGRERGVW